MASLPPSFAELNDPGQVAIDIIEARIQRHCNRVLSKAIDEPETMRLVRTLRYDFESGLKMLQACPPTLQEIVLTQMHYVSFRALQDWAIETGYGSSRMDSDLIEKETNIDLDAWVTKNEFMMRQDSTSMVGLLKLYDNLDLTFPESIIHAEFREIQRSPLPSNLCLFDQKKPTTIRIQNDNVGYIRAFNESTAGVLGGLDWRNIVVAGGLALHTLLRVSEAGGDEKHENMWDIADADGDIDIFIYGIKDQNEADSKIEHIYEVWCRNVDEAALKSGNEVPKKLIVRNSRTINFMSSYPHRRIQIILKVVASPTEVLLGFDLDPCAIAFDGQEVFMLPRCARALETGYSVFVTDLVEGPSNRRETRLPRIYKYADRGFGIRISPQYLWHLENFGVPYQRQSLIRPKGQGLGRFEILNWHSANWQEELEHLRSIEQGTVTSPLNPLDGYAELPKYKWDATFTTEAYAKCIEEYNRNLESGVTGWIPSISETFDSCAERLICGVNISEILRRELIIPMYLPKILVDYANRLFKEATKEHGISQKAMDSELLVPICKDGAGKGIGSTEGECKWVFWIIEPCVSRAGIDPRIDEIFEMLSSFFSIGVPVKQPGRSDESSLWIWSGLLQSHLDRRRERDKKALPNRNDGTGSLVFVWPDAPEIQRFTKWYTKGSSTHSKRRRIDHSLMGKVNRLSKPRFR